jgi:predicted 3-demethylubiquinone-9 3-methyltransferase (glyoxalase superfamily)
MAYQRRKFTWCKDHGISEQQLLMSIAKMIVANKKVTKLMKLVDLTTQVNSQGESVGSVL